MVFSEYMNSLPNLKSETIERIARETFSTPATVYRWINGAIDPPMVKKRIVAKALGKEITELWPEKEVKNESCKS